MSAGYALKVIGIAAKRYAQALLDVAKERGLESRCLLDLQAFQREVMRHGLMEVFRDPTCSALSLARIATEIGKAMKLSDLTVAFLHVLGSRRRLSKLDEVIFAYERELERRAGRVRGEVRSPSPLNEVQMMKIRGALSRSLGQQVILTQRTEPSLIGGLQVVVGDKVYDLSVSSYLESLRSRLLANR